MAQNIAKGATVTVDAKWSHIDGYAPTGRVTRIIPGYFQSARVRLASGALRDFPVADLRPAGGDQ